MTTLQTDLLLASPDSSIEYLTALHTYLQQHHPGMLIMPTREGGKAPLLKHKNGMYTAEIFERKGKFKCDHGAMLILAHDIIVVDVDDVALARSYCNMFPEFNQTVTTMTRHGFHFYFKRTVDWINDGSRQMGDDVPVDFKTGSKDLAKTASGVISIPPSPGKRYVRPLGLTPILPMPDAFVEFIRPLWKPETRNPTAVKPKSAKKKSVVSTASMTEVDELIGMLSPDRAGNYTDWIHIGLCLHNIDSSEQMLDRWKTFSARNKDKYDAIVCEQQWKRMSPHPSGYNVGSLHYWARTDSPDAYRAYNITRLSEPVKACNGSHNSVAEIASKVLKGLFMCASSDSKVWYLFDGCLWREDKSGIKIHTALATKVRDVFLQVAGALKQKLSIDDLQSESSRAQDCDRSYNRILGIASKLQNDGFKTSVVKVMREVMYDSTFVERLDSNPDLVAFDNGVYVLSEGRFRPSTPEDMVSLSVGYDYDPGATDSTLAALVAQYWERLHPDPLQRLYMICTIARQLFGDTGGELLHVHAGTGGSGANGKTRFFQLLGHILGQYVCKFGVETLTAKERPPVGKPMPEFGMWRGRRIIYCTEPNVDDKLNSGILKDLSGGELISYRMLYGNDIITYRPQFKIHIMTNDAPRLDGSDQGVARRVRKVDYISRFVLPEEVDESQHRYPRDTELLTRAETDPRVKMAFMRVFLDAYKSDYGFTMPPAIIQSSSTYLNDNDAVRQFVELCIEKDPAGLFTLKEARERAQAEGVRLDLGVFKARLEDKLRTECLPQKKFKGVKFVNAFLGWRLKPKVFNDTTSVGDDSLMHEDGDC